MNDLHSDFPELKEWLLDGDYAGAVCGDKPAPGNGDFQKIRSPIDGAELGEFKAATPDQVEDVVSEATRAFHAWRSVPAPRRGEFVRRLGQELRASKEALARIVTLEAGKIQSEAEGEVQEMIDICDFAVGLSRQLHGLTIATERPDHRLMEQWHPLGPVGVISAFNFPVAVWSWNAALAFVCGNPVIWKPSEKTPLCALACQALVNRARAEMDDVPPVVSSIVLGERHTGAGLTRDARVPLVSATGSIPMGRAVGQEVAARLGRTILELGGNNGMIVAPSADKELVLRAAVFAAAGTAGQRCTSLRRFIVHEDLESEYVDKLVGTFSRLQVGDPREPGTLIGPLIDRKAFAAMQKALDQAREFGATVHGGERVTEGVPSNGYYVRPAVVQGLPPRHQLIQSETFAPILYVLPYTRLDEAIQVHNDVPQGLASAIFTSHLREAEQFLSPSGSDCGIANVNIGTSGAEIGGAFGGEKETGGGRESGSDAWKNYMRRQTATINYGTELPLAQGVRFEV